MATVSKRFEIVIGRLVRLALNVRPGDRAIEVVDGNRLIVHFVPGPHRRTLRGRLHGAGSIEDFAAYRDGDAMPRTSTRNAGE